MSDTTGLWIAVDALTKSTRHPTPRDEDRDVDVVPAVDLLHDLATSDKHKVCHVAYYQRLREQAEAESNRYTTIPSLWDQATAAVTTGTEQQGRGAVPARERSIADLNLMETLFQIREVLAKELHERQRAPRASITGQMRQLASEIVSDANDVAIQWWTFRFEHWTRVIGNQIDAIDNGPKPFRLRNAPCPRCHARQIRVVENGEKRLVPPIRIDFHRGLVRAAVCGHCGHSWFRGDDGLNELADALTAQVLAEGA